MGKGVGTVAPGEEALAVAFEDVSLAADRIRGHARLTPVLAWPALDERAGAHVLVKAETLQVTGSFKYRGAYNRLAQLTPEQRRLGVVAYSSGNHAQAVAAAAKVLGVRATVVMPIDAPAIKVANTQAHGAEVVFYDRYAGDRVAIGRRLAEERGAILVPAFDDAQVIAGQGTVGLEFFRQAGEQGAHLDLLLCPCGGGGLIAGISVAFSALSPATRIYAVEPEAFDDTRRSLTSGTIFRNPKHARSICPRRTAGRPHVSDQSATAHGRTHGERRRGVQRGRLRGDRYEAGGRAGRRRRARRVAVAHDRLSGEDGRDRVVRRQYRARHAGSDLVSSIR